MDIVEYFLEKIVAPILVVLITSVIISNRKTEAENDVKKENADY